jgi:hypothetical protein
VNKKAAVIVISYNFWHDTIECLESLLRNDYPDYFVIVYDNGSTDGSLGHIMAWAGGVEPFEEVAGPLGRLSSPPLKKPLPYQLLDNHGKLIEESGKNPLLYLVEGGSNLGFPGGNNAAIGIAMDKQPGIIVLINNDTAVEPGFLSPLADFLGKDAKNGAAGGTICYYSSPGKIWAAGGGGMNWLTANSAHYGPGLDPSSLPGGPVRLDYITGCLLALRADAVEKAGMMDEKYFLYYDETDWAVRLRACGYRFFYIPSSKIYHKVSLTTENDKSINIKYYFTRNQIYFIKKNYKALKKYLSLATVLIIDLVRILNQIILKRNPRKAGILFKAAMHGLSGRMGQFIP